MERIIFSLLVFLAPTQLAIHFWPDFSHIFGIRVDYLAPTIYLTDILAFVLFFLWIRQKGKSVGKRSLFLVGLTIFAILNILSAKSGYPAIFKWGKVIEFLFLGYWVSTSKKFEIKSWFIRPLTYSVILFSSIGIIQFILGRTIGGPLYLLGERTFSLATPGIALVTLLGREFLRAYSTFPHPNSMAGYMLVVAILILFYEKNRRLKITASGLAALVVLLSFSLAAYMAVLATTLFSRINNYLLVFVFVALSMLFPLLSSYFLKNSHFSESVDKRIVLMESSAKVFSKAPIFGVGLNNFLVVSGSLQPVHNIFLLVLSETGLVGLLLFLYLIFRCLKNSLTLKHFPLTISLMVILMTGLFDHYWLTLEQNQLLLSFVFGLCLRKKVE